MTDETSQATANEWVSFPGGQLEGRRPKALCAACREALGHRAAGRVHQRAERAAASRPLCFQCYRADLDRLRALAAAGVLDTASAERFQYQLPFERIDTGRLALLKVQRAAERGVLLPHGGRFVDRRRRAQLAALHAAELQLPESWWPFVMSR